MSDIKRGSAVSPVIGTILLVAITVVLVAIIGAVMMSLADAEDGKKVGMNAQPDNIETAKAKLILYGGESISELVKLEMIDHDSPYGVYVELWNITAGAVNVGVPYTTIDDVAQPSKDMAVYDTRINVKGTFTDGREVILLVQPMTFYDVGRSKNAPLIPVVNIPDVSEITHTTVDVTFTYGNINPAVDECIIYCQLSDGTGTKFEVRGKGTDANSGSFSGKVTGLLEGREYNVWGEVITSDNDNITGDPAQFTTKTARVFAPTVTDSFGNGVKLRVYYENASSKPNSATLYYRVKDSGDDFTPLKCLNMINGGTDGYVYTGSTQYFTPNNTTYEMYAVVGGGTGWSEKGPIADIYIGETIVYAPFIASTKSNSDPTKTTVLIVTGYTNPGGGIIKGTLYYRLKDSNDDFSDIASGQGNIRVEFALDKGATYEMYTRVYGRNEGWSVPGPTTFLTIP